MRTALQAIDPAGYGLNDDAEEFTYLWGWFQVVRELWSRAAVAGRAGQPRRWAARKVRTPASA
jgi:hypothetical protein